MAAIVTATKGEAKAIRRHLAAELMLEALATNGFHEGLTLLTNAEPEDIPPATVAQAVERARLG